MQISNGRMDYKVMKVLAQQSLRETPVLYTFLLWLFSQFIMRFCQLIQ